MRTFNLLKAGYRSLNRNKLRSFLTMLGIIIGVASVIAMLAIGQGSSQSIKESMASLGTNAILVFPGSSRQGGVQQGAGTVPTIKVGDADAIALHCQLVNHVSPVDEERVQVIWGSQNWNTTIMGVRNAYLTIRSLNVTKGSSFTPEDDRIASKVCLLGVTVVLNLFGNAEANPVGQIIRINNIPFKIIGVLSKMGQNTFGRDQDDIILAPFSTVQKRMKGDSPNVNYILASAISEDQVNDAVNEISALLRQKHKLAPSDEDDFTVRTQSEITNIFGSVAKVMTILLASIAGISLLVGGIGIMNIMLVSVTERTREIGTRMAVGAKRKDILSQFIIESIVISFSGGLIGIAIGIIASDIVARFGHWPIVIEYSSIILAFLFSAAVGLFFGIYPARKAAGLNPIEALRFE